MSTTCFHMLEQVDIELKSIHSNSLEFNYIQMWILNSDEYFNNLTKTLTDIISRNIPLEIRTTYFDDNLEDRESIRKEIRELERFMEEKEFNSYYKYFEQEDFRKKIYKES